MGRCSDCHVWAPGDVGSHVHQWGYKRWNGSGGAVKAAWAKQLGTCPQPLTRWQWARHNLLHGLLMGFPLWDVVVYTIRYNADGIPPPPDSEVAG
jgi:hypothetical protein